MRTIIDFLLIPLSLLWEVVYRTRRFAYSFGIFEQKKFFVPIISVGNITFGGSGKTPFTLWLSKYISSLNKTNMILTRGYKGKLENSNGIISGSSRFVGDAEKFGDEALLLARRLSDVSVVVGKNRSANLSYYFEKEKPDVVLLDDGHQHIKLARDCNILLFDATLPLSRYKVAPRGYLREGPTAIDRADFIIIGHAEIAGEEKVEELKKYISRYARQNSRFALTRYVPAGLFGKNYDLVVPVNNLAGKKVFAVAGIATPEHFYELLESLGVIIVERRSFPDHHTYLKHEFKALEKRAKELDAIIVTTEKDMVKLRSLIEGHDTLFLEIDVEFVKGEDKLKEYLLEVVNVK